MEDKRSASDNTTKKPVVIPPEKTVQNSNPNTDENPRVRTDEQTTQHSEQAFDVDSEITDGEDG